MQKLLTNLHPLLGISFCSWVNLQWIMLQTILADCVCCHHNHNEITWQGFVVMWHWILIMWPASSLTYWCNFFWIPFGAGWLYSGSHDRECLLIELIFESVADQPLPAGSHATDSRYMMFPSLFQNNLSWFPYVEEKLQWTSDIQKTCLSLLHM